MNPQVRAKNRLEALLPEAGSVLEAFLDRKIAVKCPECEHQFEAKLPDKLALQAALAVHDRTGVGPRSTVVHEKPQPSPQEAIEGLVADLLLLPLEERVALSMSILPEYGNVLDLRSSNRPLLDTKATEEDTSSPKSV